VRTGHLTKASTTAHAKAHPGIMQRERPKVGIRVDTNRKQIEQLQALLQRKRKQLEKLQRIHRVLEQREKVCYKLHMYAVGSMVYAKASGGL
jgi:hypothetical protein